MSAACFVLTATRGFKRVCYFGSWAMKRAKVDARMDMDDIDPFMCTHLIYAFAKMNVDSLTIEGKFFETSIRCAIQIAICVSLVMSILK